MAAEHPSSNINSELVRSSPESPRSGATAAPVNSIPGRSVASASPAYSPGGRTSLSRARSHSTEVSKSMMDPPSSPGAPSSPNSEAMGTPRSRASSGRKSLTNASVAVAKAKARNAQKVNDSMVYLDGPQVYTCAQCRTHLTSHDDIISKSFHGRHGRAYLFDQCVNVTQGPSVDRRLLTGLHIVSDIFCKRCKGIVGWTYLKAYESSQKYKEGKFIIEKINLHLEESDYYEVSHPAGERADRWRKRSMSWGSESSGLGNVPRSDIVYEYQASGVLESPRDMERSPNPPRRSNTGEPPAPPFL